MSDSCTHTKTLKTTYVRGTVTIVIDRQGDDVVIELFDTGPGHNGCKEVMSLTALEASHLVAAMHRHQIELAFSDPATVEES